VRIVIRAPARALHRNAARTALLLASEASAATTICCNVTSRS